MKKRTSQVGYTASHSTLLGTMLSLNIEAARQGLETPIARLVTARLMGLAPAPGKAAVAPKG